MRSDHQRFLLAAGTAVFVLVAWACGGAAASQENPVRAYRAVESARSDTSAQLTWAYAIDVDRRGNVYLADKTALKVFAPDGRLVRTVGRQGPGPGEFTSLTGLMLMPGDSVSTFDHANGRITVFEPRTWRPAYTVELSREQLFPAREVWRVQGTRSLLAFFEAAYSPWDGRDKGRRLNVARLLNADGSLRRDSVLAVPEPQHLILHNPEGMALTPFGRMTMIALASRDRVVTAWSDSLKFDLYSVEGRHLRTVRARYAPPRRPILRRERDSLVAFFTSGGFPPEASVRRALDELGATTWPLLQGMVVDDHDRIWAGVTGARGRPTRWSAFGLDGGRVAEVELPANVEIRRIRGETVYAVATDENDVPQLVIYRLEPAGTLAMSPR